MDFNWVNEPVRKFMAGGYLEEGETVESRAVDISEAFFNWLVASGVNDKQAEELSTKFLSYLAAGYYSLSSPVWANFGRVRGLPISCNNSFIPDSVEGMAYKRAEIAMMTKHGAGTSAWLGDIRPRGSAISAGGYADGVRLPALEIESCIDNISQGNVRRGNAAIYYPVDGEDIEEFLNFREEGSPIQKTSLGVTISDKWMKEMIDGDKPKRALWAKIIKKRFESGYPYIIFSDNVNNNAPDVYKDKGRVINGSNLCVAGDTKVLTSVGYESIKALAGGIHTVWNGEEWSDATFAKTGEGKELVRVTTSDGRYLDCTPEHDWYVVPSYSSPAVKVKTKDLKEGDKLIKFDLPVIQGSKVLDKAYTNGFYSGDGCHYKGKNIIYLYGDKKDLKCHIEGVDKWNGSSGRLTGYAKGVKDKFFVPDATYSVDSRLKWLAGYFDADGTVVTVDGCSMIQVSCVEHDFIKDVQLMLQTLGIYSRVVLMRPSGSYGLPANDGTGLSKEYDCRDVYRLTLSSVNTSRLIDLGLNCHRLNLVRKEHQREAAKFNTVVSVDPIEGLHDTYCFNEPKRHMGMFNGILTGQCAEIALSSTDEESFVCNLSSMNLLKYDEWVDTDAVEVLVWFLDMVMEEYISKTDGLAFMEHARNFAVNQRALGIGTLGYHSYLQSKMIPFEGTEAKFFTSMSHKLIRDRALKASKDIAKVLGEPPMLEGYGRRNVTLMAIAPTTSSSFILGQVSPSIEPLASNYYTKDLAKGKFTYRNPYLEKLLEEKGANTHETWMSILEHGGSVQHLGMLTREEKDVFKTFSEISPLEVIQQAAIRQKFVDQSQSLNLLIRPDAPLKDVNKLMITAWELGVKSLYYQRSTNPAQEAAKNITICSSCEA